MSHEIAESRCDRHGIDRHVLVHEAGHAVAAIDHDIPFRAIVLYDHESAPRFLGGLAYAPAAIEMLSDDASTWVQPNVLGSLLFVMGGFAAEQAELGHAIDGGFLEDIRAWRIGSDRKDGTNPAELDAFLGRPFLGVVEEAQDWGVARRGRIVALADHLSSQTAPFAMTKQEVEAFLVDLPPDV